MSIVPINDTHRLPYIKGKFRAIKLGSGLTTPLKFYDSDNNDLGYEIYTNSEGYICDANGNLLGNGIFLHNDAVVSGYYQGARFVQWAVRGVDSNMQINDGKLRNKLGDVIWSANSARDYTLQWSDIAGTPNLNQWSEDEQPSVLTSSPWDTLSVGQYTKIVTVAYDTSYTPPANGIANLTLVPQPSDKTRYGQVIFLKVMDYSKARALQLWNYGDDQHKICTVIGAGTVLLALLSDGKFVCLEQSGDLNYRDFGDIELNPIVQNGNSVTNDIRYISDTTPRVLRIYGEPRDINYKIVELNLYKGDLTKERRTVLWWRPDTENAKYACLVRVWNGTEWINLIWLRPYTPMEVIFYPNAINGIDAITLDADKPTQPSVVAVTCEQERYSLDQVTSRVTSYSRPNTLPTGASRIVVQWDTSTIQTGGTSYRLVTEFVVPPNWKGDFFLKGVAHNVDTIATGSVSLHARFRTPDGVGTEHDGVLIRFGSGDDGIYRFAENGNGNLCDGCGKFFVESDATGGIYQAIG